MLGLLLFILVIVFGLYGLNEYYKIAHGVTHQKTSPAAIEALSNIIEDANADSGRILELGSGYGGFVMGLARRLPDWDIVGVEQSPTPWIVSHLRTIGKRFTNFRFYLADTMTWPLKNYDIIFVHHDVATLKKWETSIARRLQPGNLLICLNAKLPRVVPVNTIQVDSNTVFYIYQKRVQQAEPVPAQPTQDYTQQVSVDQTIEPLAEPIENQPIQQQIGL